MATLAPSPGPISIATADLQNGSHLKDLLSDAEKRVFSIGSQFAKYLAKTIGEASGAKPVPLSINKDAEWTTSTGVSFALGPAAKCAIAVADTSTKFAVAKSISSDETNDISADPIAGKVYVNIDLDFDIKGSASVGGPVGAIGVAGKASGSASTTLTYCHAVDRSTDTLTAIKEAFSAVVFPFHPDSAMLMPQGDVVRVNFDGSLTFELDVTYGIATYKFSAPGVDSAKQSVQLGVEKLSLPAAEVDCGASASIEYTHADHFTTILIKDGPHAATAWLLRSATDETGASLGLTAGLSISGNVASVDPAALAKGVNGITGQVGQKVAGLADKLGSALVGKANSWLSSDAGDVGFMAQLSRQTKRAMLYAFRVDLTNPDVANRSWSEFSTGDVRGALKLGGISVLPGSGVGDELKRSSSISLHFFNFFRLQDTATYFQDSDVEIGPDGSIRFLYDVGDEKEVETKKTLERCRIHFVASAVPGDQNTVHDTEVDLYIELADKGHPDEAARIADALGSMPAAQVQDTQAAMHRFIAGNKGAPVALMGILKPSAYQRLNCSEYTGDKHDVPPALPQQQDSDNYEAFRDASRSLLDLDFVSSLDYSRWQQFNLLCNGETSGIPDRRNTGNPNAVPPSFFGQLNRQAVTYFFLSAAAFMNLCDDLHSLAGAVEQIDTEEKWKSLLSRLTWLVQHDVNADWTKPVARSIFGLCHANQVQTDLQTSSTSLTCTVTLSEAERVMASANP